MTTATLLPDWAQDGWATPMQKRTTRALLIDPSAATELPQRVTRGQTQNVPPRRIAGDRNAQGCSVWQHTRRTRRLHGHRKTPQKSVGPVQKWCRFTRLVRHAGVHAEPRFLVSGRLSFGSVDNRKRMTIDDLRRYAVARSLFPRTSLPNA